MTWRLAAAVVVLAGLAAPGCSSVVVAITFFQPGHQLGPARLPEGAAEHRITTADGGQVQLFHVARPGATRCVVYFHGTGGYAATRLPLAVALASAAEADVVVAEYRGYGDSPGEPSEQSMYADARAALRWVGSELGHPAGRTVLIGRSLGAAITCEVLGDAPWAGTVLMTPFWSGRAMAGAHGLNSLDWMLGRPFVSSEKLPAFHGAVLIVHGANDAVIPVAQGERLYEHANDPKRFVKVAGGTHNRLFDDTAACVRELAGFVRECVP